MLVLKRIMLFVWLLAIAKGAFATEKRPTVDFDKQTYYLVNFFRGSTKTVETYIPKGQNLSNFTSQIERVELHDIFNASVAAEGLAYQYDNNRLPHKIIKNEKEPILLGTYYSPMHTVVLDKEIYIFRVLENSSRVVYYTYLEREFVKPGSDDIKERMKDTARLLIDDKYIDLIKKLTID